ncbi:DUF7793 family protein [Algibacter pacificus]|uniref:DUF7793 family protein n=1 Tax=Algibacter pacificus TaxID=2599389 RepID=UPI0011C7ADD5|nr:STAS/SEC14 domain-containing protein [Algibacter pacificus]
MITFIFNETLRIVETEFKGDISEEDILEYMDVFKDNKTYPRHLKTLVDMTQTKFSFSYRSLKTFNLAKTESLKHYHIVASAIIVNNPATAAIATLYQAIASNKKYKSKVFSTRSAAIRWLEAFNFTDN